MSAEHPTDRQIKRDFEACSDELAAHKTACEHCHGGERWCVEGALLKMRRLALFRRLQTIS